MLLAALIVCPLVFSGLCLLLRRGAAWRLFLVAGAALHLAIVLGTWRAPAPFAPDALIGLDAPGHLLLTPVSVLFLAVAIYSVGYHQQALVSQQVACMLAMLCVLSLVCASQHLGLLWVALEAASLTATPLIYFRLGPRSLQATWKFLLMNSVGIALALLGTLALGLSTTPVPGPISLAVGQLTPLAAGLDPVWLRAGFLLALVGFGTKMGLAPLQSWKPDAYGESPPTVAALLAGGMTLGAFLAILRFVQVANAAGQSQFVAFWLIGFGLLSIATAAVFVIGGTDYRRLLAYTSVEHMGVLVLGTGLGVAGSYAAMLHALHNTLNKGVLFLVAGLLWRLYRTNRTGEIRGVLARHPLVGVLLLLGLCATCGLPPFGMFYSELGILLAAAGQGRWWTLALFVLTLGVLFVGLVSAVLPMAFGEPVEVSKRPPQHPAGWGWRRVAMLLPTAALALLALGLGIYQPPAVRDALKSAAATVVASTPSTVAGAAGADLIAEARR